MKKKKIRRLSYLILYKNHKYDVIREDKLNPRQLSSKDIQTILVPCTDRENLYIPMKPSSLYDFHRVHVAIQYRVFTFDLESTAGEDLIDTTYEIDCFNLIDLANALFNLYKFRGVSIFIAENLYIENSTVTDTLYPIKIKIDFYSERDTLIHTIESKTMSSFTKHNPEKFRAFPPPYSWEDRFVCLEDMMFVPMGNPYRKLEPGIDGLDLMIALVDEHHWKSLHRFKQALEQDYVLHKIADFEAYYLITGDVMCRLEESNFSSWEIFITCAVMSPEEKANYFPNKDKITWQTKTKIYDDYFNDGIAYAVFPVQFSMQDFVDFLTIYAFIFVIMNYVSYFTWLSYSFESDDLATIGFLVFDDHRNHFNPQHMLLDRELNPDSLVRTISHLIERN